jgi:IS30 family transposase
VLSELDEAVIIEIRRKTLLLLDELLELMQPQIANSLAIDRATRYVYLELHDNKCMETVIDFLCQTVQHYPFKIEKILTDNGIEFSYNLLVEAKQPKIKLHPFVALCQEHKIEHRTTLVKHPRTNGMVEAMNKKIKANTVKRFHYDSVDQLKYHLFAYLMNYNFNLNTALLDA